MRCIFIIVTCLVGLGRPVSSSWGNQDCFGGPLLDRTEIRVFITLSPLARTLSDGTTEQRQIILNWINHETYPSDWIGLFEHDPTNNPTLPLVRISPQDHPEGFYKTSIQFGRPYLSPSSQSSHLSYWIGFVRNGATISSNSFKSRFHWMWNNREYLGDIPLPKMMLPGTHNSGSYRHYEGRASDTVFLRYLVCQDEDIWNQLGYGIRYLDIRVGYYPDQEEKFWMNHNYAKVNPISHLIRDLKRFLQATKEVVVVDFHRFPVGFRRNAHQKHNQLVALLEKELGDFMVPASFIYNATLNNLWAINKTLIVAYADDHTKSFHPLLWPRIPQEWGDKRSVEDLYDFLSSVADKRHNFFYFWTAMAELTPSTFDVLFRPGDGLRKLADLTNNNVTAWYRDLWWWRSKNVAVDFFHSTDIVETAILANKKKQYCIEVARQSEYRRVSSVGTTSMLSVESAPLYHGPRSLDVARNETAETDAGNERRLSRRRNSPVS